MAGMTDRELVSDWLGKIGETDPVCIAACLQQCVTDKSAREYFVNCARTNFGVETINPEAA